METILKDLDCNGIPASIDTVSILLTNDKEIHKLNKEYRGKDKPTDVLSFSHIEGLEPEPWDTSLGELVISLDTTAKQSKEYKVSFSEELTRLIVHGILHLFGYDHEGVSKAKAQKMRRLEERLRLLLPRQTLV